MTPSASAGNRLHLPRVKPSRRTRSKVSTQEHFKFRTYPLKLLKTLLCQIQKWNTSFSILVMYLWSESELVKSDIGQFLDKMVFLWRIKLWEWSVKPVLDTFRCNNGFKVIIGYKIFVSSSSRFRNNVHTYTFSWPLLIWRNCQITVQLKKLFQLTSKQWLNC